MVGGKIHGQGHCYTVTKAIKATICAPFCDCTSIICALVYLQGFKKLTTVWTVCTEKIIIIFNGAVITSYIVEMTAQYLLSCTWITCMTLELLERALLRCCNRAVCNPPS